jgi:hypothetical protein
LNINKFKLETPQNKGFPSEEKFYYSSVSIIIYFCLTYGKEQEYSEGTSYAAPRVSGVIALLLSADPTLDYDKIYEALKITNTPNGETGYGVVNAIQAYSHVSD